MPQAFDVRVNLGFQTKNLRPAVSNVKQQLSGATVTADPNSLRNVAALNNHLQRLGANISVVSKQARQAHAALVSMGGSIAGKDIEKFNKKIGSTVNNLIDLQGRTYSAKAELQKFGEQAGLSFRRFGAFAVSAIAFSRFVGEVRDGFKEALKFQHAMVQLSQLGVATSRDIKSVSDNITNLSKSLGASSTELADMTKYLKGAGLSIGEVNSALSVLAKTSLSPTFGSIKETGEGLLSLRSQFKLTARDYESTFDSINAISQQFAAESEDLVEAVKRAGAAFVSSSGDFAAPKEQLNQLLSLFTAVRSTTRESADSIATGFRTIFSRLQSNDTINDLKNLGINLRYTADEAKVLGANVEGQFVGGFNAIQRLNVALKNIPTTDPIFAAVVEKVGGTRQVSKVLPLIQQFDVAQRALAVAQTSNNSLTRDSEKAQESFVVKLSKVKEEFLELFRVISNNQAFKSLLDGFASLTHYTTIAIKQFESLLPLIAAIGAVKIGSSLGSIATGAARVITHGRPRFYAMATGGMVPGSGTGDTVPAMLTPKEFVLNTKAAQKIGYAKLHSWNQGHFSSEVDYDRHVASKELADKIQGKGGMLAMYAQHFAKGGIVRKINPKEIKRAFGSLGIDIDPSVLTSGVNIVTPEHAASKTGGPTKAYFSSKDRGIGIASNVQGDVTDLIGHELGHAISNHFGQKYGVGPRSTKLKGTVFSYLGKVGREHFFKDKEAFYKKNFSRYNESDFNEEGFANLVQQYVIAQQRAAEGKRTLKAHAHPDVQKSFAYLRDKVLPAISAEPKPATRTNPLMAAFAAIKNRIRPHVAAQALINRDYDDIDEPEPDYVTETKKKKLNAAYLKHRLKEAGDYDDGEPDPLDVPKISEPTRDISKEEELSIRNSIASNDTPDISSKPTRAGGNSVQLAEEDEESREGRFINPGDKLIDGDKHQRKSLREAYNNFLQDKGISDADLPSVGAGSESHGAVSAVPFSLVEAGRGGQGGYKIDEASSDSGRHGLSAAELQAIEIQDNAEKRAEAVKNERIATGDPHIMAPRSSTPSIKPFSAQTILNKVAQEKLLDHPDIVPSVELSEPNYVHPDKAVRTALTILARQQGNEFKTQEAYQQLHSNITSGQPFDVHKGGPGQATHVYKGVTALANELGYDIPDGNIVGGHKTSLTARVTPVKRETSEALYQQLKDKGLLAKYQSLGDVDTAIKSGNGKPFIVNPEIDPLKERFLRQRAKELGVGFQKRSANQPLSKTHRNFDPEDTSYSRDKREAANDEHYKKLEADRQTREQAREKARQELHTPNDDAILMDKFPALKAAPPPGSFVGPPLPPGFVRRGGDDAAIPPTGGGGNGPRDPVIDILTKIYNELKGFRSDAKSSRKATSSRSGGDTVTKTRTKRSGKKVDVNDRVSIPVYHSEDGIVGLPAPTPQYRKRTVPDYKREDMEERKRAQESLVRDRALIQSRISGGDATNDDLKKLVEIESRIDRYNVESRSKSSNKPPNYSGSKVEGATYLPPTPDLDPLAGKNTVYASLIGRREFSPHEGDAEYQRKGEYGLKNDYNPHVRGVIPLDPIVPVESRRIKHPPDFFKSLGLDLPTVSNLPSPVHDDRDIADASRLFSSSTTKDKNEQELHKLKTVIHSAFNQLPSGKSAKDILKDADDNFLATLTTPGKSDTRELIGAHQSDLLTNENFADHLSREALNNVGYGSHHRTMHNLVETSFGVEDLPKKTEGFKPRRLFTRDQERLQKALRPRSVFDSYGNLTQSLPEVDEDEPVDVGSTRDFVKGFPQYQKIVKTNRVSQRLRGIGSKFKGITAGNKGRVAFGVGALAATFAPAVMDHVVGTAEKPGVYGASGFKTGSAATGALQYGITGASIGSIIGPWGTAIGGAVGALLGFTTGLKEADKSLKEVDFNKTFGQLSSSLEDVLTGKGDLSAGAIGKVGRGLSAINKGAFDAGADRDKYLRDRLVPLAPQLKEFGNKIIGNIDFGDEDLTREGKTSRLDKFRNAGGQKIAESIAAATDSPLSKIYDEFDKSIIEINNERINREKNTKALQAQTIEIQKFSRISDAFDAASVSASNLQNGLNSLESSFGGGLNAIGVKNHSDSARIGNIDTSAFNAAVNHVSSSVGGKVGNDFGGVIRGVNQASLQLPDIINKAHSDSLGNDAALRKNIDDGLKNSDIPETVRSKLSDLLDSIKPEELADKTGENVQKFVDDLLEKGFANVNKVLGDAAKQLEQRANAFNQGLITNQEMINKVGESQDRHADLQVAAAKSANRFRSEAFNRPGNADIAISTQLEPFRLRQERLTGLAGGAAQSPSAIAAKLQGTQAQIASVRDARDNSSGHEQEALSQRLAELQGNAQRLGQALANLADSSQKNAIIQEKINKLEEDRQGRLSFTEKLLTSDPKQQREIFKNSNLSDIAVQQGSFAGFGAKQISGVLEHLSSLGQSQLPGYGNRTAADVRQHLLLNSGLGIGTIDPRRERQRVGLFGEQAKNDATAVDAQGEITKNQQGLQQQFFAELKTIQQQFFDKLRQNLAEAEKRDLKTQEGAASGKLNDIDKSAKSLDVLRSGGFSLDKARKLQSNEDLSRLSDLASQHGRLTDGFGLGQLQSHFANAKVKIGKDGLNADQEGDITSRISQQFGLNPGEARKEIVDPLIRPHLTGGSNDPNHYGNIVNRAIDIYRNKKLNSINQEKVDLSNNISNQVYGTNDDEHVSAVKRFAVDRGKYSEALDSLKGYKTEDELNNSRNSAAQSLVDVKNRRASLDTELAQTKAPVKFTPAPIEGVQSINVARELPYAPTVRVKKKSYSQKFDEALGRVPKTPNVQPSDIAVREVRTKKKSYSQRFDEAMGRNKPKIAATEAQQRRRQRAANDPKQNLNQSHVPVITPRDEIKSKPTGDFGEGIQNFGSIVNSFNQTINNLSKVLGSFHVPEKIVLERSGKIEVVLNGAEMMNSIKKDLAEAVGKEVLATMEQKLPKLMSNLPAHV